MLLRLHGSNFPAGTGCGYATLKDCSTSERREEARALRKSMFSGSVAHAERQSAFIKPTRSRRPTLGDSTLLLLVLGLLIRASLLGQQAAQTAWSLIPPESLLPFPEPLRHKQRSGAHFLPTASTLPGLVISRSSGSISHPVRLEGRWDPGPAYLSWEAHSAIALRVWLDGIPWGDPAERGHQRLLPDPAVIDRVTLDPMGTLSPFAFRGPSLFLEPIEARASWRGTFTVWPGAWESSTDRVVPRAPSAETRRLEHCRRATVQVSGPFSRRAHLRLAGAATAWQQQAEQGSWHRGAWSFLAGFMWPSASSRFALNYVHAGHTQDGYGNPLGLEQLSQSWGVPPWRPSKWLDERVVIQRVSLRGTTPWDGNRAGLELNYAYQRGMTDVNPRTPSQASLTFWDLLTGEIRGPSPIHGHGRHQQHSVGLVAHLERGSGPYGVRLAMGTGLSYYSVDQRLQTGPQPVVVTTIERVAYSLTLRPSGSPIYDGFEAGGFATAMVILPGRFRVRSGLQGAQTTLQAKYAAAPPIKWPSLEPEIGFSLRPWSRLELAAGSFLAVLPPSGVHIAYNGGPGYSGFQQQWLDPSRAREPDPGTTGNIVRRFGPAYGEINPGIRPPRYREVYAAFQWHLSQRLRVEGRAFRRDWHNRLAIVNQGVPFQWPSGYPSYIPRKVHDRGGDWVAGTADDQWLFVFERLPETFAKDRFELRNVSLSALAAGLRIGIDGSGTRWWWRADFTAEKGHGSTASGNSPWLNDPYAVGPLLDDPNALLNATGRTYFDRAYSARVHAFYRAPAKLGGWNLGISAAYWDGLPFGRRLLVEDLAQGPIVVFATPRGSPEGGHRTEYLMSVDLRVSRSFELKRGELTALVDIFNLAQRHSKLIERDWSGPEFERRPALELQPGRTVRLGLEYQF